MHCLFQLVWNDDDPFARFLAAAVTYTPKARDRAEANQQFADVMLKQAMEGYTKQATVLGDKKPFRYEVTRRPDTVERMYIRHCRAYDPDGFTKTLDVAVLLKRTYFSEVDYQKHSAYFKVVFRCKMPKDRYLEYAYFKYDKKSMGSVAIRNFDSGLTFTIDIMSKDNQKEFGIKPIGKPVKISAEKANVMLREKEVLGLFNDLGHNIVIVKT